VPASARLTWTRRAFAAALAVASAATVGVLASSAQLVDTETKRGGTLSTGSIDIWEPDWYGVIDASGLMPGDSLVQPMWISNNGTLNARYALTGTTDNAALGSVLQVEAKQEANCAIAVWSGLAGYSNYGPGTLATTSGQAIVGDKATGYQDGDRFLDAGEGELMCFRVTLPLSAPNTAAGQTAHITLTAHAEQTKNNQPKASLLTFNPSYVGEPLPISVSTQTINRSAVAGGPANVPSNVAYQASSNGITASWGTAPTMTGITGYIVSLDRWSDSWVDPAVTAQSASGTVSATTTLTKRYASFIPQGYGTYKLRVQAIGGGTFTTVIWLA